MCHKFKHKKIILLISIIFFSIISLLSPRSIVKADTSDEVVETVATYNYKNIPEDAMATIKEIVSNDNTVSMKVKNGKLILTRIYTNSPNVESNLLASSFIQLNRQNSNVRIINFNEALAKMDNNNGMENIKNGSPLFLYGTSFYAGQTRNGEHVSKGTHVHCNRFNGTHSDHRYWSHFNIRAYIDFYHSDCDYHALKYHCSMSGKNVKCDGTNYHHHGVHDCSSWKGGIPHKNWPKTCWYRN